MLSVPQAKTQVHSPMLVSLATKCLLHQKEDRQETGGSQSYKHKKSKYIYSMLHFLRRERGEWWRFMSTPRPTSIAREKVNDGPYLGKRGPSQANRSRGYCQREERVSRDLTVALLWAGWPLALSLQETLHLSSPKIDKNTLGWQQGNL